MLGNVAQTTVDIDTRSIMPSAHKKTGDTNADTP